MLLDGFLALSGDTTIFAGKYLGVVAAVSLSGELRYLAESIRPPEPAFLMTKGRARWVRHGLLMASEGLVAHGPSFHVLSRRLNGTKICSFVDSYVVRTGEYYKSLKLPCRQRWRAMAVGNDFLYAASDQGIYQWPASALLSDQSRDDVLTGQHLITALGSDKKKGEMQ